MKFIEPGKDICCNDVIKCIFDLNKLDMDTYKILEKNKEKSAGEIAKKLKKERSTVYRSLQRLVCCGLCIKKTKTLKKGGYYHIYHPVTKKETKNKIEQCIDNWYYTMKQTLEEL